jgi:hypothetical protein
LAPLEETIQVIGYFVAILISKAAHNYTPEAPCFGKIAADSVAAAGERTRRPWIVHSMRLILV